jgi:FkbM family methyltransferase
MLDQIFESIPKLQSIHTRNTPIFDLLSSVVKKEIRDQFKESDNQFLFLKKLGKIILPYYKMGAITSYDLFSLNGLIIYSFYWQNRNNYKKVLDLGANIGSHSIVLGKIGFDVESYEPDPDHYKKLIENIKLNNLGNVKAYEAAVSNYEGTSKFTRVLGNTTSSHLFGDKTPYGQLEYFNVKVLDIKNLIEGKDLVKVDIEGHESIILDELNEKHFKKIDFLVEISNEKNRDEIFPLIREHSISIFAQKLGWQKVRKISDLPSSYQEGEIFISNKNEMPWL